MSSITKAAAVQLEAGKLSHFLTTSFPHYVCEQLIRKYTKEMDFEMVNRVQRVQQTLPQNDKVVSMQKKTEIKVDLKKFPMKVMIALDATVSPEIVSLINNAIKKMGKVELACSTSIIAYMPKEDAALCVKKISKVKGVVVKTELVGTVGVVTTKK
jgi:ribosomal protein S12